MCIYIYIVFGDDDNDENDDDDDGGGDDDDIPNTWLHMDTIQYTLIWTYIYIYFKVIFMYLHPSIYAYDIVCLNV